MVIYKKVFSREKIYIISMKLKRRNGQNVRYLRKIIFVWLYKNGQMEKEISENKCEHRKMNTKKIYWQYGVTNRTGDHVSLLVRK